MQIFLTSFIIILNFYTIGILILKNLYFHNFLSKFSFSCVLGAIIISFIALLINFFLPLNQLTGNIFIILSLILSLLYFLNEKNKKDLIKSTFILSIISTLLIIYSNINRPDAGLYHLPYIQLINENKILIGISNIHLRFGHISIIQYLSAIYFNSFFPIETILLPSSILVGSIFLYFFSFFDKKCNFLELQVFISLITIYSLYSFNRYSGFGNDALSHLILFLIAIFFLRSQFQIKDLENFGIIVLFSIFIFMQKTFMIFLPFICFLIYLTFLIKINIYKNYLVIFSILFICLWFIKNILISGCLIFPISLLCFENLSFVNMETIKNFEVHAESWSKDWPNRIDSDISMEVFNQNFNWLEIWFDNHFQIIFKKFYPFLLFKLIILIYGIFFFKNSSKKINNEFVKKNYFIFLLSFLFTIIWFLKFPIYRYGQSFLALTSIVSFTLCFVYFTNIQKIYNLMLISITIVTIIIVSKNLIRIYKYNEIRNEWPNIYTLSEKKEDNYKKQLIPIYNKNNFIYYFSDNGECMYNLSPCSNFLIENINKKVKYGYEIFYIENY